MGVRGLGGNDGAKYGNEPGRGSFPMMYVVNPSHDGTMDGEMMSDMGDTCCPNKMRPDRSGWPTTP